MWIVGTSFSPSSSQHTQRANPGCAWFGGDRGPRNTPSTWSDEVLPNGLTLPKHRIEPTAILQTRYRSESTKQQTEAWQQMTCKTSVWKDPGEWGYPLVEGWLMVRMDHAWVAAISWCTPCTHWAFRGRNGQDASWSTHQSPTPPECTRTTQHHWWTGARQAHWHPEALRPRDHLEWWNAACSGPDTIPAGGQPHENPTLPAVAGARRGHPQQEGQIHLRDPGPQEGRDRQGLQVESRRPLRGVCRHDLGS